MLVVLLTNPLEFESSSMSPLTSSSFPAPGIPQRGFAALRHFAQASLSGTLTGWPGRVGIFVWILFLIFHVAFLLRLSPSSVESGSWQSVPQAQSLTHRANRKRTTDPPSLRATRTPFSLAYRPAAVSMFRIVCRVLLHAALHQAADGPANEASLSEPDKNGSASRVPEPVAKAKLTEVIETNVTPSNVLETSLTHTWPYTHGIAVLSLLLASLLILWWYRWEHGEVRLGPRVLLASFRILQLAIVLFMMYGWVLQRERTDLPDLAIVVDDSTSMAWQDTYAQPAEREVATQSARRSGFEPPTRWNLATGLLAGSQQPWLPAWSQQYRLHCFLVGESARPLIASSPERLVSELLATRPQQSASRLGENLLQVLDAQRGRSTDAVVFLTDGASTGGASLAVAAQAARQRQVPIYVVGLGDMHPLRDLRIFDLRADDRVFVDDMLTFDLQVSGTGMIQRPLQVQLRRQSDGTVLDEQTVPIPASGATVPVRLIDRPQVEGTIEYLIELQPQEGETNLENNRLVHRVEVRDETLRVLLVQATPSYEYRALRKLLSRALKPGREPPQKAILLTTILQEADPAYVAQASVGPENTLVARAGFPVSREELFAYDVILFGDVNPALLGIQELQHVVDYVREQGGGVVFSSGPLYLPQAYFDSPLSGLFPFVSPTDRMRSETASGNPSAGMPTTSTEPLQSLDPMPTGVRVDESNGQSRVWQHPLQVLPTPVGRESPVLQLGNTAAENEAVWRNLPPVYEVHALPELKPGVRVLAAFQDTQRANSTIAPAMTLQFIGAGKVVFLASDETYRWSRYEGGEQVYARYWLQMIRYLSRGRLQANEAVELTTDRSSYQAQDEVRLQVRFGNERLAPESDDGVEILLEAADGRRRSFRLQRDTQRRGQFSTTIRDLPASTYRVTLVTPILERAPQTILFEVQPPAAESTQLQMQADELKQLARVSGGRFYTLSTADRLPAELPRGGRLPIETLPAEPIWNTPLLTALFLVLLTSEWVLRKQFGLL